MAHFEHSPGELPLHPVLAAEWFRAAAEGIPLIGRGGLSCISNASEFVDISLR
jgi:hypothetical protein